MCAFAIDRDTENEIAELGRGKVYLFSFENVCLYVIIIFYYFFECEIRIYFIQLKTNIGERLPRFFIYRYCKFEFGFTIELEDIAFVLHYFLVAILFDCLCTVVT